MNVFCVWVKGQKMGTAMYIRAANRKAARDYAAKYFDVATYRVDVTAMQPATDRKVTVNTLNVETGE